MRGMPLLVSEHAVKMPLLSIFLAAISQPGLASHNTSCHGCNMECMKVCTVSCVTHRVSEVQSEVSATCRRVVSSLSYTLTTGFPQGKKFKSLGMLLKMAYLPELTERIVIILDDKPEVWLTPSDKTLASLYLVKPQQYVNSDLDDRKETWLQMFCPMAIATHQLVFEQHEPTQPLHAIFGDVAKHYMQSALLR